MRGRYGAEFHAFSEYDGFSLIENQKAQIVSDINSQPDNYILNVNKTEYIEHLVSKYTIQPIELHRDQLSASTYEAQIPAERHPHSYWVDSGESYTRDIIEKEKGGQAALRWTGNIFLFCSKSATGLNSIVPKTCLWLLPLRPPNSSKYSNGLLRNNQRILLK